MSKKIETLFLAYLEGNISKEDEIFLLEWLKSNPDAIGDFNDFRRIWNMSTMAGTVSDDSLEKEWMQLRQRIENADLSSGTMKIWYWLPRVAAIFILGAMVSLLAVWVVSRSQQAPLTYQVMHTPAGAKSQITLPDGSVVWLNAGSSLKYASNFGLKNREVELSGEAFFDVETDAAKVFLVQTSELNIKAYGTAFNVKSYPEEGTIETTLIEGKIGVTRSSFSSKKTDEVMLEPNQRVVYYRKQQRLAKATNNAVTNNTAKKSEGERAQKLTFLISKGIDTKTFTSWKDGTLFITSETLQQLAVKLERKYDVKIHFETKQLQELKFTGSLEDETVEQVIEAISMAARINYEIEDRDIWFKERRN